MQRYLQLTITEPLEPNDERVQIESAIIGVDFHTGHVTLPGGFICTLENLTQVVDRMRSEQRRWEYVMWRLT